MAAALGVVGVDGTDGMGPGIPMRPGAGSYGPAWRGGGGICCGGGRGGACAAIWLGVGPRGGGGSEGCCVLPEYMGL